MTGLDDTIPQRPRYALAALMGFAGIMHFVQPRFFDDLIPDVVPGTPRWWTYGSGAAELVAASLLLDRRTARVGAWATFAVLLGVYPANIADTVAHPPTDARGVASLVRLPLQIPLLVWALWLARGTDARSG